MLDSIWEGTSRKTVLSASWRKNCITMMWQSFLAWTVTVTKLWWCGHLSVLWTPRERSRSHATAPCRMSSGVLSCLKNPSSAHKVSEKFSYSLVAVYHATTLCKHGRGIWVQRVWRFQRVWSREHVFIKTWLNANTSGKRRIGWC